MYQKYFLPIYAKIWKVYLKCIYSMHTPQAEETQSIRTWKQIVFYLFIFSITHQYPKYYPFSKYLLLFIAWKIDCFWWCKQKVKFRSFLCHVVYIRSYLKLIAKIYQWKDPPLKKSKTNYVESFYLLILNRSLNTKARFYLFL